MIRPEQFPHYMDRIDQQIRATKNKAARLAAFGRAIMLGKKNGHFAIIHPCTDGKYAWQISRFDKLGPYSDNRGNTFEELAEMAIDDGFKRLLKIDS